MRNTINSLAGWALRPLKSERQTLCPINRTPHSPFSTQMTQAQPTALKRAHYHGTRRVSYSDKSGANKQKPSVANSVWFRQCSGFGFCVSVGEQCVTQLNGASFWPQRAAVRSLRIQFLSLYWWISRSLVVNDKWGSDTPL